MLKDAPNSSTARFKLVMDCELKLDARVPERYAAQVQEGQEVTIRVDAYSVATGVEGPGWVELLHPESGDLREADILIRGGQDKLAEGTRAQLRNAAAMESPASPPSSAR